MVRIVPELFVSGGRAAVDFYAEAFGAVEDYRVGDEEIVAQLSVGDATFWVHDEAPSLGNVSPGPTTTVRLLLVVDDPDAAVERAVAAGATADGPVADEHGWRLGRVTDPFGHRWEIGKPLIPWPPAR
jgi:PhnB protein